MLSRASIFTMHVYWRDRDTPNTDQAIQVADRFFVLSEVFCLGIARLHKALFSGMKKWVWNFPWKKDCTSWSPIFGRVSYWKGRRPAAGMVSQHHQHHSVWILRFPKRCNIPVDVHGWYFTDGLSWPFEFHLGWSNPNTKKGWCFRCGSQPTLYQNHVNQKDHHLLC